METTKYYKQMKVVTIVAIAMSLFWLYWTVGHSFNTLTWKGVELREGFETLQIGIIVSYCILSIVLIALQITFLVKQLKSIKRCILFDKSNVKYLISWAIVWMFYDFCSGNLGRMVINGTFNEITIEGSVFGISVIAFVFAILYKMAADVAEENNLTI